MDQNQNEFRYGWAEAEEDWDYLAQPTVQMFSAPKDFVPPEALSYKGIVHIENQGNMGSCTGHGGSTCLEVLEYLSNGGTIQLSRMWMYLEAQRACGMLGSDQGASIAGVIQAMINVGCCFESEYPYPIHYQTTETAAERTSAALKKILGHQPLTSAQDIFDWQSQAKGPVLIGFNVTQAYENLTGKNSIITPAILSGRSKGGHCVALAGYEGAVDSKGKKLMSQPGSWDVSWGDAGWGYWSWDALDLMCQKNKGQSSVFGITNIKGFDPVRVARIVAWSEVM